MKIIPIILIGLLLTSPAYAKFRILLKDGTTFTWSNYFEEKDNYCTHKSFGKFCVSKNDVASIKPEDESGSAVVPFPKGRPEAEKEKEKPKQLTKEKPEVEKEKEKGKEKATPLIEKSFRFEVKNPNVRIFIPELPSIPMEPHPMSANRPDLRFQGSAEPFIVSIRTPTADAGMTAAECASSISKSIIAQGRLKDSEVSLRKSSDGNTFAMYYPQRIRQFLFLKAHLFSAHGGRYCIEVHVTKGPASDDEIKKWLEGFPKAKIESY